MSVLDDLKALAAALPDHAKPAAEDVVDVLAAVVHTLVTNGVLQETAPPDSSDEPPTVGSVVFDVAPADTRPAPEPDSPVNAPPPPAEAPPLEPAPPDVAELEREIAIRSDELQSLLIQRADAQKTQHASD